jgi:hypothetical protein
MPQTPHIEKHFTAGDTVRDIVIGMSDGLTVPFALAAGLSGAVAGTGIIVTAGFAEIAAGSIAMGLGGFLAARSDADPPHGPEFVATFCELACAVMGPEVAHVLRVVYAKEGVR